MTELVNNSGQGKGTPVVDLVAKRFNWGAFFFTWIWGLCNNTYITLLFIPIAIIAGILLVVLMIANQPILGIFIYLIMLLSAQIWLGIKGNTWAWQNKKFTSIEHFHDNQKVWAIVGAVLIILPTLAQIGIIAAMTLPTLMADTSSQQVRTMRLKTINGATNAAMMNEALENKCKLTSNGLAKCFEQRLNVTNSEGNVLTLADSTVWKFNGDGKCASSGDCSIDVEYKNESILTIPLMLNENNYIVADYEKLEKYMK